MSFTVEPGTTDTVIYDTGFTPSALGTYTVTATLPEDSLATNNALSEDFVMTQHLYGHNHPLGSSVIDFTQEGLIGVGNQFGVVANEVVKGLDVSFAGGTTARDWSNTSPPNAPLLPTSSPTKPETQLSC